MTHLLAFVIGLAVGYWLYSIVHRCPPTSTDSGPVALVIHAGPVTEQPTSKE
jgi:hypothetical protein